MAKLDANQNAELDNYYAVLIGVTLKHWSDLCDLGRDVRRRVGCLVREKDEVWGKIRELKGDGEVDEEKVRVRSPTLVPVSWSVQADDDELFSE